MIKKSDLKTFNIKTSKDVEDFASYVFNDLKCNYHPDDTFHDMIDEDGSQTFEDDAADYLDEINDLCFVVCGDHYYEIGCDILFKLIEESKK